MSDVPPGDEGLSWEEEVAAKMAHLFREYVGFSYDEDSISPEKSYILGQIKFLYKFVCDFDSRLLTQQEREDLRATFNSEEFLDALRDFLKDIFQTTGAHSGGYIKSSPLSALSGPLSRFIFKWRELQSEREKDQTVLGAITEHTRRIWIADFGVRAPVAANDDNPIPPKPPQKAS